MADEHLPAIDDANLVGIGQHGEQALHLGVRDGIIVEVEAHMGVLPAFTATRSMRWGLSGNASSLGASAAKTSRTLRVSCPGQHRSAGQAAAPSLGLDIEVVEWPMPAGLVPALPSADAPASAAMPTPSHLLLRAGGAVPPFSSGESSAQPWHRYLGVKDAATSPDWAR